VHRGILCRHPLQESLTLDLKMRIIPVTLCFLSTSLARSASLRPRVSTKALIGGNS